MIEKIKNLLIPHSGNNFRPNLLERFSMGVMLVLVLLSFAMANLQALLWMSSDWLVSTILPAVIVDLTNDERADVALTSLTRNPVLDAAATLKAKDMAENEYFAHYSPDGVSPWYWFERSGYNYLHAGENLAVHFTESDEVVEAWMASPSHRANIMNGEYTEIGVGTAKGEYKGQPTIFVVQLFGTPRKVVPETAPVTVAVNPPDEVREEIVVENVRELPLPTNVAPAVVDTELVVAEEVEVVPEPIAQTEELTTVALSEAAAPESVDVEPSQVVFTSLATTSREGEPTIPAQMSEESQNAPTLPLRPATEPSLWLETLYVLLSVLVLVALTASIAYEWRKHHPVQIAYAGGLVAAMMLLMYIHTSLTGQVLIL